MITVGEVRHPSQLGELGTNLRREFPDAADYRKVAADIGALNEVLPARIRATLEARNVPDDVIQALVTDVSQALFAAQDVAARAALVSVDADGVGAAIKQIAERISDALRARPPAGSGFTVTGGA